MDKHESGSPEPEKSGSGSGSSFIQGLKGFAEKGKNHFTDVGKAALKTAIKHPGDTAGVIRGNPLSAIKTSYHMKKEYNRLQEARKAKAPDDPKPDPASSAPDTRQR